MIILIKIFIAHIIGDFVLQPKKWVDDKEQKKIYSLKFYFHILLHGILVFFILFDFQLWLLSILIMLIHGLIDIIKLYIQTENNKLKLFVIDQLLHVLSIIIIWYFWFEPELNITQIFENKDVWIYLSAILFLIFACKIIIGIMLSKWTKELFNGVNDSLVNAGQYIGIIERLLIFIFIINSHWEAVGFLITAKSVFRFANIKDAQDKKLTEYILIGTLISFGIAILTGITVLKLIN